MTSGRSADPCLEASDKACLKFICTTWSLETTGWSSPMLQVYPPAEGFTSLRGFTTRFGRARWFVAGREIFARNLALKRPRDQRFNGRAIVSERGAQRGPSARAPNRLAR